MALTLAGYTDTISPNYQTTSSIQTKPHQIEFLERSSFDSHAIKLNNRKGQESKKTASKSGTDIFHYPLQVIRSCHLCSKVSTKLSQPISFAHRTLLNFLLIFKTWNHQSCICAIQSLSHIFLLWSSTQNMWYSAYTVWTFYILKDFRYKYFQCKEFNITHAGGSCTFSYTLRNYFWISQ